MKEWTAGELTEHVKEKFDFIAIIWRNNQLRVKGRTFMGRKGVPDLIGFMRKTGIFFCCEIKTMNDKFSQDQIDFLNEASAAGGFAFVCRQNKDYTIEIINWNTIKIP